MWQPIETAPKDGTWVLLYIPGFTLSIGLWREKKTPKAKTTGWWLSDMGSIAQGPEQPTHWMPLPEPPDAS